MLPSSFLFFFFFLNSLWCCSKTSGWALVDWDGVKAQMVLVAVCLFPVWDWWILEVQVWWREKKDAIFVGVLLRWWAVQWYCYVDGRRKKGDAGYVSIIAEMTTICEGGGVWLEACGLEMVDRPVMVGSRDASSDGWNDRFGGCFGCTRRDWFTWDIILNGRKLV